MQFIQSGTTRAVLVVMLATAATCALAPPASASEATSPVPVGMPAPVERKVVTYTQTVDLGLLYDEADDAAVSGDDLGSSQQESAQSGSSALAPEAEVGSPGTEPVAPSADAVLDLQPSAPLPQTGGELAPEEGEGAGRTNYVNNDSCGLVAHLTAQAGYTNGVLTDVSYNADAIADCSSAEPYMQSQVAVSRGQLGVTRTAWAKCSNCTQSFNYLKGFVGGTGYGTWFATGHFTISGFKGQKFRSVNVDGKYCGTSSDQKAVSCALRTKPFYIPPAA